MPKTKPPGESARQALERYVKKVAVAKLADRVGASRKTIYALLWGTRTPSLALAARIEEETGIRASRWAR